MGIGAYCDESLNRMDTEAFSDVWSSGENTANPGVKLTYALISVGLILLAGLMSGLTLGLMSLDMVDLEVTICYATVHAVYKALHAIARRTVL